MAFRQSDQPKEWIKPGPRVPHILEGKRKDIYGRTVTIPTAPQEFRFCKGGAKHWA